MQVGDKLRDMWDIDNTWFPHYDLVGTAATSFDRHFDRLGDCETTTMRSLITDVWRAGDTTAGDADAGR